MQKRSLYAVIIAVVVGITGAILALSRRRVTSISETVVRTPITEIQHSPVQKAPIPALQEQPATNEVAQPSILILLASGIGHACLIAAQSLLLHSRNPILPLLLFGAGVLLLQPVLALQAQSQSLKITPLVGENRIVPVILAMSVIVLILNIAAPPPLPGYFQVLSALIGVLIVPAIYVMGTVFADSQVGLIAAGFAAVSGWTLALSKAEPKYVVLAVISAVSLVALEYIRRMRRNLIYALGLAIFLGAIIVLARVMTPTVIPDPPRQEQIPANPQLLLSEGLFTSLLMFNLTSDPNPLHGIVNRPVFSPILSALFVVGLLTLAWHVYVCRRRVDIFLLVALVITLLPSALQFSLPVRYPDLQRGAMALPVAMVIASLGVSSLIQPLVARLDRVGAVIALALLIAALILIAVDANRHYTNVFLPIYEQGAYLPK